MYAAWTGSSLDFEPLLKVAIPATIAVGGGLWLFMKKQSADAAQIFQAGILSEFQGLYRIPVEWPDGLGIEHRLRRSFPKLQTIVAAYRPYVTNKKKFDDAWLTYRNAYKREQDDQCYHHYMNFISTHGTLDGPVTEVTDAKGNFKRNVEALLSFA
jgi:hypothetical protein